MHSTLWVNNHFLSNLTYHKESSSVVIFLQEFVFSFRSFVCNNFRISSHFLSSFIFCHVAYSVYFHFFFLTAKIVKRENDQFKLTLSRRRPLSYRNHSIDLKSKSMDWFLYDNGLHHERVKSTLLLNRRFLLILLSTHSRPMFSII